MELEEEFGSIAQALLLQILGVTIRHMTKQLREELITLTSTDHQFDEAIHSYGQSSPIPSQSST
jgi:hypothetical protein